MSPPPGYVAYGSPESYGTTFQRIGGLTKALITLSVIGIVALVGSLVAQLALRSQALEYRNDEMTLSEFTDKVGPYLGTSAVVGLVGLATLVVQIIWTFRIAKNMQVLGRQSRSFSPGGTIAVNILGGCTLSILPYFMWRELWKGSDPDAPAGDPAWKQRPVGMIVHLWFAAALVTIGASLALGVSSAIVRVNRGSNTTLAKQLDTQIGYVVSAGALGIVAAIAFVILIRQLSARHMQATREA
jgi:Domain of unknown function (DUF4328)